jgi:peptidylprolyl isomerase
MRRTLPVFIAAIVLLAACGSDSSESDTSDVTDTSTVTESSSAPGDSTDSTDPAETGNPDKPAVETPEEIPTELVVTVIEPGSGPMSEAGDTVIVDYVGVRSEDGVEFDNSYDRGEPFPVVVGTGSVIQGWDDGLVGVQAGSRIQLDIPSDLAYGESANGELIPCWRIVP